MVKRTLRPPMIVTHPFTVYAVRYNRAELRNVIETTRGTRLRYLPARAASQNLATYAGGARHTVQLWDELRT